MDHNETARLVRQARSEARRAELEAAQRRLEHDQHLTDQRRITALTEGPPPVRPGLGGVEGL